MRAVVAVLFRFKLRRRADFHRAPVHRAAADATLTAQRTPTASPLSFPGLKAEACRAPGQHPAQVKLPRLVRARSIQQREPSLRGRKTAQVRELDLNRGQRLDARILPEREANVQLHAQPRYIIQLLEDGIDRLLALISADKRKTAPDPVSQHLDVGFVYCRKAIPYVRAAGFERPTRSEERR